jgi:anti-anti-sigma factor
MEITRTPGAEQFEIKLKGRLDAIWSDHVSRALDECIRGGEHTLAVDMSEVDYISSAGIRILVIFARQLKAIHGRLTVINPSSAVRSVLQLAGLGSLLSISADAATTASAVPRPALRQVVLPLRGSVVDAYDLQPDGVLKVEQIGDATEWLAGQMPSHRPSGVEFPVNVMGLGCGAFGSSDASNGVFPGEFLAAGGAAVCQPADGASKPDYMLLQGALTPTVNVNYGLVGRGRFQRLLRFDKGAEQTHVPLSAVVQVCFDAVGSDSVGIVMVAETSALVGASLQRTPGSQSVGEGRGIFAFPEVRDWLSFTAESAFANTTTLVVGLATRESHGADLRLLRPLVHSGQIRGHFHAVAFPYRPLRKGQIDLADTVQALFEGEQLLGMLHLLNDWRPGSGAGESRFLRGACWCTPWNP